MLTSMSAKLSIVATPIGNLEDVSARALRTLKECDAVLCEDTRVTGKLLSHYDIKKPLVSYHAHSGRAKYEKILERIEGGEHLALVSDAGTPSISDPGALLVDTIRKQYGESVVIETIPGPSAVTAALALSGFSSDSFLFLGFPPHKKGRKTFFEAIATSPYTTVFYESPHRIMKALESLAEVLTPERRVAVCRELSKLYEESVIGTAPQVLARFTERPDTVRGEFVVVIESPK